MLNLTSLKNMVRRTEKASIDALATVEMQLAAAKAEIIALRVELSARDEALTALANKAIEQTAVILTLSDSSKTVSDVLTALMETSVAQEAKLADLDTRVPKTPTLK